MHAGKNKHVIHSFSFYRDFDPVNFPGKALNETILPQSITIFPSLELFHSKVLMRHIFNRYSSKSIISI